MKNTDQHNKDFEDKFGEAGKNSFSVPDGYFETLPGRISQSISNREKSTAGRRFFLNPTYVISLATAAVILLAIGLNFNSIRDYFDRSPAGPVYSMQDLTDDEIIEALMSEGIREDVLVEMAVASPSTLPSSELPGDIIIDEYITDQIDEDLIIEEL
jgi:hypothetical protein